MAVEIPVVVDIEGAFKDAARRVESAMRPMKKKIEGDVLKVKYTMTVPIDELDKFDHKFKLIEEDVETGLATIERSFEQLFENGKPNIEELGKALGSFKLQLEGMWNSDKPLDQKRLEALQQAVILSEEYVQQRNRAVRLTNEQYAAALRAKREEERREFIIASEAKTISEINQRLSALREKLQHLPNKSAEWASTGREIMKATAQLEKFEQKYTKATTKPGSINRITSEMQALTQQWNAMSKAQKFDKDGRLKASAQKIIDKYRQLSLEAQRTGKSLEEMANKAAVKNEVYNTSLNKTNSRLVTLLKNSARLFAIHTASRFLRSIREVTSEFELQKVALGSIIQDTEYANSLFKKIKAAAVESPFQIKELVTYTKQLSAYQIETEKLFDTTMKLADISAGLGVDMGRLILAFGQVRAASVLRGQELRQFTEAGIPLVDRLAQKFTELNGRLVTTTEVFELISKRAVPFSMIEDIFNDMTSAGGSFYRMQEKQAETLLGQWNNLKDSISIMYDEIGNTSAVHRAMEALIADAKGIMQNWRFIAGFVKSAGLQFIALKVASAFIPTLTKSSKLLEKAEASYASSKIRLNAAVRSGNELSILAARAQYRYAYYTKKAAQATTLWGRSVNQLKAFFLGNWLSLVTIAIGGIVSAIWGAISQARELNKELYRIGAEGSNRINQAERNFVRLADKAVKAADGSKEQSDAVAELKRTYGDLLPEQDKVIEKLREMNGEYKSLTDAIRENINQQILEQKLEAVIASYGKKIGRVQDKIKKALKDIGYSSDEVSAFFDSLQSAIDDAMDKGISPESINNLEKLNEIFYEATGKDGAFTPKWSILWGSEQSDVQKATESLLPKLIDLYGNLRRKTDDVTESMEGLTGATGKYGKQWKELQSEISIQQGAGDTDFAKNRDRIQKVADLYKKWFEKIFNESHIDISSAFKFGKPDFKMLKDFAAKITDDVARKNLTEYIAKYQKEYEKLIPDDKITEATTAKLMEISETTGVSMDKLRTYIKSAGKDSQEYLKELSNSIEQYNNKSQELKALGEKSKGLFPFDEEANKKAIKDNNEIANALQMLYDWISKIIPLSAKAKKSLADQASKEVADITNAYKKYVELRKYKSKEGALSDIGTLFPSLKGWQPTYENMISKLEGMLGKYRGNADATRIIRQAIANVKFDKIKDDLDTMLQRMADELKRSETARNFYNEILGLTGDQQLATNLSVSIYGDVGSEFRDRIQKQMDDAFKTLDWDALDKKTGGILLAAYRTQDFDTILKNIDQFPEKIRERLKEIITDTEKFNADLAKELVKSLANAKTYSDKRIDIANQTAKRLADIDSLNISEKAKEQMREQNTRKEAEEVAKLEYEAFKETPMYVELFANLDRASTDMLRNMRDRLLELKGQWGDSLPPTELKEMQSRLKEIDQQLATKNPFKALIDSIKEYRAMTSKMSRGEADSRATSATAYADMQKELLVIAKENYDAVVAKEGANSEAARQAEDELNAQKDTTDEAIEQANAAQETANAYRSAAQHISDAAKGLETWAGYVSDALGGIEKIVDTFASDEVSETFSIIAGGINNTLGGAAKLAMGLAMGPMGIPTIIAGLGDLIKGIFGTANELRIKRANNQIKTQTRLIEDLEESYEKLNKAMDKSFGDEYVYNLNKMLETLEAEYEAYRKQAAAERSKGKKTDEDALRGYEKSARDTLEKMKELRQEASSFFAGSDLASAAESFADAWLSAYEEFGDTAGAIEERMTDMVQNLVKKAALSGIAQAVMADWYSSLADIQDWNAKTVAEKWKEAMALVDPMVQGMNNFASAMQAEGVSLRNTTGQFSGIARNIAGATEESITGLAAGVNTQNFYMSHIDANVAAILSVISGGSQGGSDIPVGVSSTDLMIQYMSTLPSIDQNLAELLRKVSSVISPKSAATNTHYIAVK